MSELKRSQLKKKPLTEHTMQRAKIGKPILRSWGGGVAYAIRSGYVARVLEVIECKSET